MCLDWTVIQGSLKHVSASMNYIWGVDAANRVYMAVRSNNPQLKLIPEEMVQVNAGDEEVWGVSPTGGLYKMPVDGSSETWTHVRDDMKYISASGNGYIWGVTSIMGIVNCKKPCTTDWVDVEGTFKQVNGGQEFVYGISNTSQIYSKPLDGIGPWRSIDGSLFKDVTASGFDEIFAVDNENQLFRCRKPCESNHWEQMAGEMVQCDATFEELICVNPSNVILSFPI